MFFVLLATHFRFSSRFDKIIDNIESISEKVNNIAVFVESEADKTKKSLSDMHDALDNVTSSFYGITNSLRDFTDNFNFMNTINSIVGLFKRKNKTDDDEFNF